MKLLTLFSLSLTAPLLLTGCASIPSIEDQAKLIEYEKCLSLALEETNRIIETTINALPNADLERKLEWASFTDFEMAFNSRLDKCKKFRP